MNGYTFVYGVDGFGADVAPAFEEGVYLDFETAFNHQMELNKSRIDNCCLYEDGYGEDYYSTLNRILEEAEDNEDWDTYTKELEKHKITKLSAICKRINDLDEPPYDMYQLVEVEIIS